MGGTLVAECDRASVEVGADPRRAHNEGAFAREEGRSQVESLEPEEEAEVFRDALVGGRDRVGSAEAEGEVVGLGQPNRIEDSRHALKGQDSLVKVFRSKADPVESNDPNPEQTML